jgi:SMC interacting uncharacterized protein involved in chromosome segregation
LFHLLQEKEELMQQVKERDMASEAKITELEKQVRQLQDSQLLAELEAERSFIQQLKAKIGKSPTSFIL